MRNKLKKTLLFITGGLLIATVSSFAPNAPKKEVNVWHKVSTDNVNPGLIIPLDMSKGYSFCEGPLMYIVVSDMDSEDDIVVVFPNGGYWDSPKPDPFLEEMQKEFDSLEEYLKSKGGTEWKKN
tara:strand:+ start:105 stop:476 length:372 start_codon:yes stop_codon:yes gene_type:complete